MKGNILDRLEREQLYLYIGLVSLYFWSHWAYGWPGISRISKPSARPKAA